MRTGIPALCAVLAVCAVAGAASAEETGTKVSFSVTGASDYAFRGVSQTDGGISLQPGVEVSHGMLYAGAWASNVDFGDSTDAEIDLYAGVKPSVGGFDLDLGAIYYGYVDQPRGAGWDYWEFKGGISRSVGKATIGAEVYYSPDYASAADDDEALYYEINASVPLHEKLTLSGALGSQQLEGAADYTTWHVGLTYQLLPFVAADLRYHDTDEETLGKAGHARVVAGLSLTWP